MRIKDIPIEFRPREKALTFGINTLSDEELIALIINSGVKNKSALEIASSLLKTYLNISNLKEVRYEELKEEFGLSKISALKLEAIFEFHKRLLKPRYDHDLSCSNSEAVYQRYKYLENEIEEHLILLLLDYRFHIIKERILYIGSEDEINIKIKKLIYEILAVNTSKVVMIHNHPICDYHPSRDDVLSTQKIKEICSLIGVTFFDHIIISKEGYFSFKDAKILK